MKPPSFQYHCPADLAEALALMADADSEIRPIAGGQSLVPMMSLRLARPEALIDLGRITSLRGIRVEDDGVLVVGAMTRHSDFEWSEEVRARLPLLHAAMPLVAHTAIRNRGTIGGSLAHADPAGDWPALCVACDAELVLSRQGSERTVRAEDFGEGIFSTALKQGELITHVRFPVWTSRRRWGLQKMTRRRGDFALAGVVVVLDQAAGGEVDWARIVVYGSTDTPVLLREAAALLVGRRPNASLVEAAAEAACAAVEVRSDLHASAEYRHDLVRVMVRRALEQALPESRRLH